ncbi:hypothetical protein LCGC14_1412200 [marine sediment metagenome]|uniref:Uncharacterized protein n=1 Tax=marine sediment metagenome TaxID=412755 RepID=A0A0F9M9D3_9ZZZZ
MNTEVSGKEVACPFCNEGDYDLVGLKYHLVGNDFPCKAFGDTLTVEEEQYLRRAKHGQDSQQ